MGSLRQQAQAKVAAFLGLRRHNADFMHRAVDTEDCQACHAREDNRHPVYRFNEPKFVEARSELGAHRCTGCHVEHRGERVSMPVGACETCHAEIELREEPLDVSHAELAETGRWQSCLGCHDFHGNHAHSAPTRIANALPIEEVRAYLADGSSPYGPVVVEALQVRGETP